MDTLRTQAPAGGRSTLTLSLLSALSLSAACSGKAASMVGDETITTSGTLRLSALPPGMQVPGCEACGQMAVVPAGSFRMGTPGEEPGRTVKEGPPHEVHIESFEVGRTEVTQGQWKAVMGGVALEPADARFSTRVKNFVSRLRTHNNPSSFSACGDECPAENISWNDAQVFIAQLNQRSGRTYRLPTEAEWEYAARAGTTGTFWWGAGINVNQANYNGTLPFNGGEIGQYRKTTLRADSFPANPFGLYNVSGNVWEWVLDCWNDSYVAAPANGAAWLTGDCTQHIMRGGSWIDEPNRLRLGFRTKDVPGPKARDHYTGFRLARSLR
jgi:formylglycine-generating enzyme required for sulfatase activity